MYAIVCRSYGGRTLLFRSWPAESSVDNSSDSMLCTYQTSACTVLYIRMLYCIYEAIHTFYPLFFYTNMVVALASYQLLLPPFSAFFSS